MDQDAVLDGIKEILNIAGGRMAKVMGELSGCEITLTPPRARILKAHKELVFTGGTDPMMLVGYLGLLGDNLGSVIFLIPENNALTYCEAAFKSPVSEESFPTELEEGLLSEVMNNATQAFLDTAKTMIELEYVHQEPRISIVEELNIIRFLEAMDEPVDEYLKKNFIVISLSYTLDELNKSGKIFMVISPLILDSIMEKIEGMC